MLFRSSGRVVEASTVVVIPKAPMLALLAQRPDLALRMLGSMSQHLRVLVGALDDLTLKDVETRLLNWLLRNSGPGGGEIRLRGTKRVLAAEIGTSSETLSRTFARLREALQEHHVVCFRGQSLDEAQQIAFSELFGPLETFPEKDKTKSQSTIYNVANVSPEGRHLPVDDHRVIAQKVNAR